MENKKSFIFIETMQETIQELNDQPELQLELYKAIINYGLYQEDTAKTPMIKALMVQFKMILDSQQKKRKTLADNGRKGGSKPKQSESKTKQKKANEKQNESLIENCKLKIENCKSNNIYTLGEFKNVKLNDDQIKKLQEAYGRTQTNAYIKYLDEYIEMKGYKAKNHYLAIKKWVVDAVAEEEARKQKNQRKENRDEIIPEYDNTNNPKLDNKRFEEIIRRRNNESIN